MTGNEGDVEEYLINFKKEFVWKKIERTTSLSVKDSGIRIYASQTVYRFSTNWPNTYSYRYISQSIQRKPSYLQNHTNTYLTAY